MKTFIIKTNTWFDSIEEPYRYVITIFLVAPGFIAIANNNVMFMRIFGPIYIVLLIGWRMLGKYFKRKGSVL